MKKIVLIFTELLLCVALPSCISSSCSVRDKSIKMIKVESGTFVMGSSDQTGSAYPPHDVTLDTFYIAATTVTEKFYDYVLGKIETDPQNSVSTKKAVFPAVGISWDDAIEFCNILSERDGYTPCYSLNGNEVICDFSANGYRLPTEAEWEYAANGGNNAIYYTYSGSDTLDEVGWYAGNSNSQVQAVAQKEPNSLGIYDMTGNIWEWCWDSYASYSQEEQINPTGPKDGDIKSVRGGCCFSNEAMCALYTRNYFPRNIYGKNLGFRLCRSGWSNKQQ